MITCKLYGRLGNQMFQIAATVAHAMRHGFTYRIPKQSINPDAWGDHPFKLIGYYDEWIRDVWKEPSHRYHEIPAQDHLQLDGYFQSYKYFDSEIETIRAKFDIPEQIIPGILGIHYRAGDYKLYPNLHPIPPKAYFDKALTLFSDIQINQVIVFTDDPAAAKLIFPFYPINFSENPIDDFYRLCMCEHIIATNSSFSVMAAILNRNPDKKIIAVDHSQYFGSGNADLETQDIYPDYFTEIKY